jgi:hypothetical protein
MSDNEKYTRLTISVEPDFPNIAKAQAHKNHMSLSAYIRYLIRQDEKRGED